jgi:hypothetical protein
LVESLEQRQLLSVNGLFDSEGQAARSTTSGIVEEQDTTTTTPDPPTTPGDPTGEGVLVDIPKDLTAVAGSVVTVPVNILDDASGVVTAGMIVRYNSRLLSTTSAQITPGDLWPDAYIRVAVNDEIGAVAITLVRNDPIADGATGSLVEIEFDVSETATAGSTTPIDLDTAVLNDGTTHLEEVPKGGPDTTDGLITMVNPPAPPPGHMDVTLTGGPTEVNMVTGEVVGSLPENLPWVHEWASFNVEIWVSIASEGAGVLAGGSLVLLYDTGFFTATNVEFGPGFVGQTQEINDDSGRVTVEGLATVIGIGVDHPTLLARVGFAATPNDAGLALFEDGEYVSNFPDLELSVEAAHVDFVGQVAEDPSVGSLPLTQVAPLVYDIDDDGSVTMGDLSYLAFSFNKYVDDSVSPLIRAADFDHSGRADFGDLALMATNFGLGRSDAAGALFSPYLLAYWEADKLRVVSDGSAGQAAPGSKGAVPVAVAQSAPRLTESQLVPVLEAAVDRLQPFLGADAAVAVQGVTVEVADLPGDIVGAVDGQTVVIDVDAAGHGWYVDATPADDTEFVRSGDSQLLFAESGSPAAGRVDLLTVVMHELGHVLGLDHTTSGIMADALLLGTRRLPAGDFSELLSEIDEVDDPVGQEDRGAVDDAFATL